MPSGASEVGASFWVTSQGSKLMNLLLVWRTQKPCSALQWHIERRELFCKNTQLYMCAQALTHTYYKTFCSLTHE